MGDLGECLGHIAWYGELHLLLPGFELFWHDPQEASGSVGPKLSGVLGSAQLLCCPGRLAASLRSRGWLSVGNFLITLTVLMILSSRPSSSLASTSRIPRCHNYGGAWGSQCAQRVLVGVQEGIFHWEILAATPSSNH